MINAQELKKLRQQLSDAHKRIQELESRFPDGVISIYTLRYRDIHGVWVPDPDCLYNYYATRELAQKAVDESNERLVQKLVEVYLAIPGNENSRKYQEEIVRGRLEYHEGHAQICPFEITIS